MKKVLVSGIITATIIAVAGVIFYACKKDPAEIANKTRVMGNVSGDELREFENYTPSETIIEEKLLMINNCVNDPDANPMPNMELKEAVWFLEAYFNLGVCQWQEYPCEYVDKKETYSIEIPHANGWVEGEDVFLDGQQLQSAYRTLLQNIVADVCFEYAINFGDVFVQAVNEDVVTLGLEICYGPKQGQKSGDDYDVPCSGGTPYYGRLIATDMSSSQVKYPTDLPNPSYTYSVYKFLDKEVKDTGMTNVLMQKRTWQVPMGVKVVNKWEYSIVPGNFTQDFQSFNIFNNHFINYFDINFYNNQGGGYDYGTIYRNHIWNVLLPQAIAQYSLPAGSIPFEVECKIKHETKTNTINEGRIWHTFGIIRTCSYFADPCFVTDVQFTL